MTELCLISVPHNGTMFMVEMFTANGWLELPLNAPHRRELEPVLYHGHCQKLSQCMHAADLADRMPLIVPLRHPYRVEESWKRRGEELSRLITAYELMLGYVYPSVKVWVPLDADNHVRQRTRLELNHVTGKTLSIIWDRPVNVVHHTYATPLSSLDPSPAIREICMHPLFRELYGDGD